MILVLMMMQVSVMMRAESEADRSKEIHSHYTEATRGEGIGKKRDIEQDMVPAALKSERKVLWNQCLVYDRDVQCLAPVLLQCHAVTRVNSTPFTSKNHKSNTHSLNKSIVSRL